MRVVTATLPPNIPGMIGRDGEILVLILDGDQMNQMPWDERIRICNLLLATQDAPTAQDGPPPTVHAQTCARSNILHLETRLVRAGSRLLSQHRETG